MKYGIMVEDKGSDKELSESKDAASDILSAIASKDAKALDLALQRHYETCKDMGSEEDEEDM